MEMKIAKIEPIEFTPSRNFKYFHALQNDKSWWSRAWHGNSFLVNFSGCGTLIGIIFGALGLLAWLGGAGGLLFGISSGVLAVSFVGLHFNARRVQKENGKIFANQEWRFLFLLAQGVEAFNRRATAWNGMLAALELGAEDRMSQEEKENMHRMLSSAREELARRVQMAEGLMLPPCDHRPQVAAYLEELRDTDRELLGKIAVPDRSLNQNNFQNVLENEVALFECGEEFKALPSKKD